MEEKEAQLKKDLETEVSDKKKEELLKIDDIIAAIHKIKDVPDQHRLEKIVKVLRKMDDDHDGSLKIDDVLKVSKNETLFCLNEDHITFVYIAIFSKIQPNFKNFV